MTKIEALMDVIIGLIGEEEKTPDEKIREAVGDPALYMFAHRYSRNINGSVQDV